ncbi:MAG: TonB family protein [Terracidiphilus sp.]
MFRLPRFIPFLFAIIFSGELFAQLSVAPVLITAPNVNYPPIAKAARVEGAVVVDFSIDMDGQTSSVRTISGPMMLRGAVEEQIKQWRFKTPLPINAQEDFKATYTFHIANLDENLDDELDRPLWESSGGCIVILPEGAAQVTGKVRSLDGSQTIDVTPAAAPPAADRCPNDNEKQPPTKIDASDYVELYRSAYVEQNTDEYRIRIYRDGRVEWHGENKVAIKGDQHVQINSQIAAALLALFQDASFWSACSVVLPPPPHKVDDDFTSGDYLTVSIGGHMKTVNSSYNSFSNAETGAKFAWAVDKAVNAHRWRHGDSVSEPYTNMDDDLSLPKPGVTALMRATHRFSPNNAQQTLEPLKYLIAKGAVIDAADESGWTALMYAAYFDSYYNEAVRLLLEAHADPNRASLHGDTALMMAAYTGYLNESLIDKGAEINAQNADGVTALMLLAQHINPDDLKDAIAAGADANAKDNAGRTALDYLRAASCQKPLIPLPKPFAQIVYDGPIPCPGTSEEFLKSQSLLLEAMKKHASR